MSEPFTRRLVTLASLYGTGDEVIGRRLAERLGVVFVDREIPAFVAERLGLPESAAQAYDEQPRSTFDGSSSPWRTLPSQSPPPERLEASFHREQALLSVRSC
jgi:hypothetical protein